MGVGSVQTIEEHALETAACFVPRKLDVFLKRMQVPRLIVSPFFFFLTTVECMFDLGCFGRVVKCIHLVAFMLLAISSSGH